MKQYKIPQSPPTDTFQPVTTELPTRAADLLSLITLRRLATEVVTSPAFSLTFLTASEPHIPHPSTVPTGNNPASWELLPKPRHSFRESARWPFHSSVFGGVCKPSLRRRLRFHSVPIAGKNQQKGKGGRNRRQDVRHTPPSTLRCNATSDDKSHANPGRQDCTEHNNQNRESRILPSIAAANTPLFLSEASAGKRSPLPPPGSICSIMQRRDTQTSHTYLSREFAYLFLH